MPPARRNTARCSDVSVVDARVCSPGRATQPNPAAAMSPARRNSRSLRRPANATCNASAASTSPRKPFPPSSNSTPPASADDRAFVALARDACRFGIWIAGRRVKAASPDAELGHRATIWLAVSVAANAARLGNSTMKEKAKVRRLVLGYADPAVHDARHVDRIPNAETLESIRQVEAGEDLIEYENMDEFMKDYEEFKHSES